MTYQHKEFTPVIRGVEGAGQVSIVLATLNEPDHDADVTLPGFFGRQTAAILPSHDFSSVPLGKALIREQGGQAIADLQFNLKVNAAADWYEAIRYDYENGPSIQEYSYGFTVLDGGSRIGEFKGQHVRFLQPKSDGSPGVAVHEVSPVLIAAGVGTRTLAVKRGKLSVQAELQRIYEDVTRDELKAIAERLQQDMQCAEQQAVLESAARTVSIAYKAARAVSLGTEAAAQRAVARYAPQLGLDAGDIKVRYFTKANDSDDADIVNYSLNALNGFCRPNADPHTIWLRSDLDAADAYAVAAHELRHVAGGDETAAMQYGEQARNDNREN